MVFRRKCDQLITIVHRAWVDCCWVADVVAAAGVVFGAGFLGFGFASVAVAAAGVAPPLFAFSLEPSLGAGFAEDLSLGVSFAAESLAWSLPPGVSLAVAAFFFSGLGLALASPQPACGAPGAGGFTPV